ncbi:MAG: hypothetical protein GF398_09235 [Chitinivibrionales bacterium]|nr:hypothetical protein [Chitinivibrionales bacterium]
MLSKSILTVFTITCCSKLLGFLREIIFINKVGVGAQTDTYFAAFSIIEFLILFCGFNAMKSVTTSTISKEISLNRNPNDFFSSMSFVLFAYGGIIALCLLFFTEFIVGIFYPGFQLELKNLTTQNIQILSFLILAKGMYFVWGAALGVYKQFVAQNISILIINTLLIATILFVAPDNIIKILCVVNVLGYSAATLFEYFSLKRSKIHFKFVKIGNIRRHIKKILKVGLPLLFVTAAFSLAGAVDKAIASFFGNGIVTALNISYTLCFFSVSLFLVPLSNVLFPHFSKLYYQNDMVGLRRIYNSSQIVIFVIFSPIALSLAVFSKEILNSLVLSNKISSEQMLLSLSFLKLYSISIIFNVVYNLNALVFQSSQKNKLVGYIGVVAYLINMIFSITLSKIIGPEGIAIGTICCFMFFMLSSQALLWKEFGLQISKYALKKIAFVLAASIGIALSVKQMSVWWQIAGDGILPNLTYLAANISLYIGIYTIIISLAFRINIKDFYRRTIKKKT